MNSNIVEIDVVDGKVNDVSYWKARALQAEKRSENYELAISYARDLVKMWPTVTLRNSGTFTAKIAGLQEAIDLTEK